MADFVRIFDTTLRDGEQSPGATMTRAEKLRVAKMLDEMGVDVIEAGFPAASPGELESVQALAKTVKNARVAALCRTRESDIRAAWEGVKDAAHPRIHVFIATSDIHLAHKLRMTREEVLEQIKFGVTLSKSLCDDVEFSAEDATRSDLDFLEEAMRLAVECGANVLNVPDTVGYTMPEEYADIIQRIVKVTEGTETIVSTHCHDDLGLAVANSLAAISAGARQIECCVNGLGERAGNAALEEIVMALRTRRDLMDVETRIDTRKITSISRLVSEVTGIPVQPNKAIVGRNAFAHESGIHQHGVLKQRTTYEILAPEDIGLVQSNIVLGKHSGRHALRNRLETLGFELADDELNRVFDAFKRLADKKKAIFDADLMALVNHQNPDFESFYTLTNIEFEGGSQREPTAKVVVRRGTIEATGVSNGDGPVDAALEAVRRASNVKDATLASYNISSVTEGSDAQGRVHITIDLKGRRFQGHATHTDVVVASAMAFVASLNQASALMFAGGEIETTVGLEAQA